MIAPEFASPLPDRQGAGGDIGSLPGPLRLVLDTNVLLDLFVFKDPRVSSLAHAISAGRVTVLTEPGCVEEFRRVLSYPAFALLEDDQMRLVSAYLEVAVLSLPPDAPAESLNLHCSDPDDQKFLELAWRSGATLLTRDKALLVLRRRFAAIGGATICTPESLPRSECDGGDITAAT